MLFLMPGEPPAVFFHLQKSYLPWNPAQITGLSFPKEACQDYPALRSLGSPGSPSVAPAASFGHMRAHGRRTAREESPGGTLMSRMGWKSGGLNFLNVVRNSMLFLEH